MTKSSKTAPEIPPIDLDPGLYVVSTPIGNARDITLRALDVLRAVDVVLCEDTRVTARLMSIHGVDAKLAPYHEHNARTVRPGILEKLQAGACYALVSDAGTPLVSDPGYRLVADAVQNGIPVFPIPGASSVLAGLTVSGLPSDRFLFVGFLPPKEAARRSAIAEVDGVAASLIFLETGPRLAACLADLAAMLGDRQAAVARELTKKFEEVRRGSLAELADHYATSGAPKGEITLVVAPPDKAAAEEQALSKLDDRLLAALETLSVKEAAAQVSAQLGLPKRQVYARALDLKDGR